MVGLASLNTHTVRPGTSCCVLFAPTVAVTLAITVLLGGAAR